MQGLQFANSNINEASIDTVMERLKLKVDKEGVTL